MKFTFAFEFNSAQPPFEPHREMRFVETKRGPD
jgi:hypothetical protein